MYLIVWTLWTIIQESYDKGISIFRLKWKSNHYYNIQNYNIHTQIMTYKGYGSKWSITSVI